MCVCVPVCVSEGEGEGEGEGVGVGRGRGRVRAPAYGIIERPVRVARDCPPQLVAKMASLSLLELLEFEKYPLLPVSSGVSASVLSRCRCQKKARVCVRMPGMDLRPYYLPLYTSVCSSLARYINVVYMQTGATYLFSCHSSRISWASYLDGNTSGYGGEEYPDVLGLVSVKNAGTCNPGWF